MRLLVLLASLLLATSAHAQQTGSIRGWVGDTLAGPLEGAYVSVAGAGEKARTARTDPSGQFAIESLVPGPFVVKVELPGFPTYQASVYVSAGRTTHIATLLSVGDLAKSNVEPSIRGVVRDPSGEPVAGAWVRAISIAPFQASRDDSVVVTDPSGRFEVPAPDNRMCLLLVVAPGHLGTAVGLGHVSPQKRVEVRLQRLTTDF